MTENEAKNIISTEIKKTIQSFTIDVISRDFIGCTKYTAKIVSIFKDDEITSKTLKDITDKFVDDGLTDFRIIGTSKDLRDLEYEILTIEANITIGG